MKRQIEQLAAQVSVDPESTTAAVHADASSSVDLRLLKHDVKNQLTSILCFCSLLRQSSVDLKPKQVGYIDQIQTSAKAILFLLNELGAGNRSTDPAAQNQPAPAVTD